MLKRTDEYAEPVEVTDVERLKTFLEKSRRLTPRCLGAYDKEDLICTGYCACGAIEFDLRDDASRAALNESSGAGYDSFFYAGIAVPSCRQETSRLVKAIKDAQETHGRAIALRMSRGHYIERLGRIPVGSVRYGQHVRNFVSMYLHIGQKGEKQYLYKLEPFCGPLFDTTKSELADIAEIRGRPKTAGDYIKVLSQEVEGDFLVLVVKTSKEESREVFGPTFKILLKLEDALEHYVRMDDVGALD